MEEPGKEKILVIDDEKSVLDAFKEIFLSTNYQISYAQSGKDAISKLENESFNIVIIDTTLPDIDALDLLEKIKNIDPLVRVIMMAWHTSAANITAAFQKRASEFILKPFQTSDVLRKVRKSLLFQKMSRTRERTKHLMPME